MSEASVAVGAAPPKFAQKYWADADGVQWRLRGDKWTRLEMKRVRELLLDPDVAVIHDYAGDVRSVVGDDREALWAYMEPVLDGTAVLGPNDFRGFNAQEFRNTVRQRLLLIIETC